jgi:putative membrane protein
MLSVACTNDRADRTAPAEGGANPPSATANSPNAIADVRLTETERTFVQKAAQANQMEVDMAKMGQDKAQNEQVKDFARQLEQDHSEALDELRGVASRASLELDKPDDAQRASLNDKLGNVSGRLFDGAFIREMIDDHRKDITEFETQQNTATGELKAFIDKTLPVMREHLQKAEDLQKRLGNTTSNQ